MAKVVVTFAVVAIVVGALANTGSAEFDAGQFEYRMGCAACHGVDGKGMGPVGALFGKPPADLTVLSKRNNGVFPFNSVYEVIDGRKLIIAHGTRDMPIWGPVLSGQGQNRNIGEQRLQALLAYLEQIQAK